MVYNLLIVEDSIPIRTAIKDIVKSSEFIVVQFFESSTVNEGLKILNEEIIDLVLFDFNTPDINVFRFLDIMKKDESYKLIPTIIIITERSNLGAEGLLKKHSIDYIKQPINPVEIKQKLNHIMEKNMN